jgi:N-acyl-D-aspartate/D-glutamate deacylase
MLDLRIRGGTIVDGSGAPRWRGDVGVAGGRVVAIGEVDEPARETLSADGLVVAPGFIDAHTHYDVQALWDPLLSVSPWHGVTTVVIGNCGYGIAPAAPAHREQVLRMLEAVEDMSLEDMRAGLGGEWPFQSYPEYLDVLEARGLALNLAGFLPHSNLRLHAMGEASMEREATDEELGQMCALTREAVRAGAIGLSSSHSLTHFAGTGRPVPSRLASHKEYLALARAVAEAGGHLLLDAGSPGLEELEVAARETGLRGVWVALFDGWYPLGASREVAQSRFHAWSREGLPLSAEVACYPLLFEVTFDSPFFFSSLPCFKGVLQRDREGRKEAYRDPEFRAALRQAVAPDSAARSFAGAWSRTFIADAQHGRPELEDLCVEEAARELGVDATDLVMDLSLASDLNARFRFAFANYDPREVGALLADPHNLIAVSDAGAHCGQMCQAGYATHLLGHWVRERKVFSLEEGIRRLTSHPAELFGIADRGTLAIGKPADLVIFDPSTVGASAPRRVRDLPAGGERFVTDAHGIEAVVVGGCVVRQGGSDRVEARGPLPGRLLRGGRARP